MTINFGALLTDGIAAESAVATFVKGVEKAVTDAKANGLTSIAISDIEALVPEGETVVEDIEKVVKDV